tara:strand:+ start:107 stop:295 length:189 start_codon:yes stop_codon:yes gene_type:complete
MQRYACHFENGGCIILNATDDEDAAWLGVTHARLEGTGLRDIEPLDLHHCMSKVKPLEDYYV